MSPGQKIVPVFSDQDEFRNNALALYEILYRYEELRTWIEYPMFRDMRDCAPLQAADIIAYELYKEFERKLFRPRAASLRVSIDLSDAAAVRTESPAVCFSNQRQPQYR